MRKTTYLRPLLYLSGVVASGVVMATSVLPPTMPAANGAAINLGGPPRTPLLTVVNCPPSISAAATNAPQPWNWGGVTMNVVSAKLSDQPPPQQQMLCFYEGSGSKWNIGRSIQPEFSSCAVASANSFNCRK